MTSEKELERASRFLSAGQFADCAAICGAIVARDSSDAIATHLLGLAIKEMGDWEQGEQWLRRSVQLDPQRAEFLANLGNLLRRRGKYGDAEAAYQQALRLAPDHVPARRSLALTLIDLGRAAEAEPICRALLDRNQRDVEAWILLGLTFFNLRLLHESESAYRQAIVLDPGNQIAHHNLGAVLSQLHQPANALSALDKAKDFGLGQKQGSYELAFNRGCALLELYDVDGAEREFERAVSLQPDSRQAQLQLVRVRYMMEDPKFARSLATAADSNRDHVGLQLLFAEVMWRYGNLQAAEVVLRSLIARKLGDTAATSMLASVLHEAGQLKEAETFALDAAAAAPGDPAIIETLVAILLSRGCPDDAMPFIRSQRVQRPESQGWLAYEGSAARLLDPDRYRYLYDYERLVRVFEVQPPAGWSSMRELNAALVEALAERHPFRIHPLEQSLRNGSQTTRSLLTDPHPAIKAVLMAFEQSISEYRSLLGADAAHPFASRNSGLSRFTGAWSVCLRRAGYHVNHFHPDGWISSAYYIDVPAEVADCQSRSGWLKFGEPRYSVPGLSAEHFIQPEPGRVVLFPSYMWHGTTALQGSDSRLTIAFDVKPV